MSFLLPYQVVIPTSLSGSNFYFLIRQCHFYPVLPQQVVISTSNNQCALRSQHEFFTDEKVKKKSENKEQKIVFKKGIKYVEKIST
jgi:hypothetical protein